MARIDRFYADPTTVSGYADPQLAGDLYIVHKGGRGEYECRATPVMGEFLYDGLRGAEAGEVPPGPTGPSFKDLVLLASGFMIARWLYEK